MLLRSVTRANPLNNFYFKVWRLLRSDSWKALSGDMDKGVTPITPLKSLEV